MAPLCWILETLVRPGDDTEPAVALEKAVQHKEQDWSRRTKILGRRELGSRSKTTGYELCPNLV